MAVVGTDPVNWNAVNAVQVDSDDADNVQAMFEIEDWAAEHGFVRTSEYYLRRVRRRDGKRVFRGFCYRMTAEELESAEQEASARAEAVNRQPVTSETLPE